MTSNEAWGSLYADYVKLAVENGALEAKVILATSIKTASWTRLRCQYGCSNYNTNLCCPPFTPTAEEMQKAIDDYNYALIMKFKTIADVKRATPEIERAIFLDGKYKAFGFKAGSCGLCKKCNLKNCAHPTQARPTMEASGIDVYETVRRNGFAVEVLRDKESQGSFFGLILIE
jgi:predicted metal-binding protein